MVRGLMCIYFQFFIPGGYPRYGGYSYGGYQPPKYGGYQKPQYGEFLKH